MTSEEIYERHVAEMKTWIEKEHGVNSVRNIIFLYNLIQPALILSVPTGVYYINQVAGFYCHQMYAEGILVFPEDTKRDFQKIVSEYTRNKTSLTDENADYLDTLFKQSYYFNYLMVDRKRLKDSAESWVYVTVDKDDFEFEELCWGLESTSGVLTWQRSD